MKETKVAIFSKWNAADGTSIAFFEKRV